MFFLYLFIFFIVKISLQIESSLKAPNGNQVIAELLWEVRWEGFLISLGLMSPLRHVQ